MKRKTAAICLAADSALFVASTATGAPMWTLIALAILAAPVLVVTILPEARRGA